MSDPLDLCPSDRRFAEPILNHFAKSAAAVNMRACVVDALSARQ